MATYVDRAHFGVRGSLYARHRWHRLLRAQHPTPPTAEEMAAALANLPTSQDGTPLVYQTHGPRVAISPAVHTWLSDYSAVTCRSMRSLIDEAVRCLRDAHRALVESGRADEIVRNEWAAEAADALLPVRPLGHH